MFDFMLVSLIGFVSTTNNNVNDISLTQVRYASLKECQFVSKLISDDLYSLPRNNESDKSKTFKFHCVKVERIRQ